jgi:hypothetical protein
LGGLILGAIVGLVLGFAFASSQSTVSGVPIASAAVATGTSPTTPAASPRASQALVITLGRPRQQYGTLVFPLTLQNNGSEDLSYAEADCAFYSKDGTLLTHSMTNMTNLAAGATGSNDLMVEGVTLSELARYECTAHS